jgi:hypothetical protein
MKKCLFMLLLIAALIAVASFASADDDGAPSTQGWALQHQQEGNNVAITLSIDNAQQLTSYNGIVQKKWMNIDLGNGAFIEELVLGLDGDPRVILNFAVLAGNADTTFTITSAGLSFSSINPAQGTATAAVTVTDNNGNGAVGTGLLSSGTFYEASYNNGANFAYLVNGPVNAAAWVSSTGNGNQPWQNMGSVYQMQSQFQFSLTAGDGASGTSSYVVLPPVPEPSSMAALAMGMIGFAGTAIRRRKN